MEVKNCGEIMNSGGSKLNSSVDVKPEAESPGLEASKALEVALEALAVALEALFLKSKDVGSEVLFFLLFLFLTKDTGSVAVAAAAVVLKATIKNFVGERFGSSAGGRV